MSLEKTQQNQRTRHRTMEQIMPSPCSPLSAIHQTFSQVSVLFNFVRLAGVARNGQILALARQGLAILDARFPASAVVAGGRRLS